MAPLKGKHVAECEVYLFEIEGAGLETAQNRVNLLLM
jgi:hypothetical protein